MSINVHSSKLHIGKNFKNISSVQGTALDGHLSLLLLRISLDDK